MFSEIASNLYSFILFNFLNLYKQIPIAGSLQHVWLAENFFYSACRSHKHKSLDGIQLSKHICLFITSVWGLSEIITYKDIDIWRCWHLHRYIWRCVGPKSSESLLRSWFSHESEKVCSKYLRLCFSKMYHESKVPKVELISVRINSSHESEA